MEGFEHPTHQELFHRTKKPNIKLIIRHEPRQFIYLFAKQIYPLNTLRQIIETLS